MHLVNISTYPELGNWSPLGDMYYIKGADSNANICVSSMGSTCLISNGIAGFKSLYAKNMRLDDVVIITAVPPLECDCR